MFKAMWIKLALGGALVAALLGAGVVTAHASGLFTGPATRPVPGAGLLRAEVVVAAKAIGVSEADLRTAITTNQQTIAQVAQAHNVAPQAVVDAVVQDLTAKAQARPAWATATADQKAKVLQNIKDRAGVFVNNTGQVVQRVRDAVQARIAALLQQLRPHEIQVAAQTIGVTPAELRTAIRGGKTIAQVAQAHGKTADAVITAISSDVMTKLQARPFWAGLSDQQKANVTTRVHNVATRWVNGTR